MYSNYDDFEEYMERLEFWTVAKDDAVNFIIVAHFLTFIGKEAYSLI